LFLIQIFTSNSKTRTLSHSIKEMHHRDGKRYITGMSASLQLLQTHAQKASPASQ